MEKNKVVSGRFRPWEIVVYCSKRELLSMLGKHNQRIAHYAFIEHDLDRYEEDNEELGHKKGDIKKVHIHCLLDFFDGHTFSSVKKLFTLGDLVPRVEKISDRQAKFEYLTHKNHPDKFQYSEDEIFSNDISYYKDICLRGDKKDKDNLALQIINDLLNGTNPYTMVCRYGRDYVIHRNQYKDMVFDIQQNRGSYNPKPTLTVAEIQEEIPFE